MKRFAILILVFPMFLPALPGCERVEMPENEKKSIVCTVFPQYDWVLQILGDKADDFNVALLLNNRFDMHNYQTTFDNVIMISSCDLFIYIGGESDGWVDDTLKEAVNDEMIVISLMETLGSAARAEEGNLDGAEENSHVSGESRDYHRQGSDLDYDEHVWLSLRNAQIFCRAIADALSSLDSDNASEYNNNMVAYVEELSALDLEYERAVNEAPVRSLLFGDRFPFRYLVEDYGIDYFAAFPGCSTETEAGFETIVFLADKMDELTLRSIIVTESSDLSIARSIINNTLDKNQQILVLNAMQSVALSEVQNGMTYLSIMADNLDVLKAALS